ncbi:hypothetical protein EXU85_13615 [Spirosoma sp. KCTC 42546]|uniref:hypothetical protein n=1 Tax=Spirosoma sp. KCTC 42546 TaxID=2520506 RepID=UPI00115A8878|nr:hypothetical protein [Spirosoma sp. KCTC 42546]QDK79584.1 hypothetical protein EXU85_13615 [Spirosoma sp. KCTC 42546]
MASPINIHLLKEYIKTFIATEVVFPGIPPRQWGAEFSRLELNAIYSGLRFVIKKAHPLQDRAMLAAFEQIDESESLNLHWFLYDYWREVVTILGLYPNLADSYLTSTQERTDSIQANKYW